MTPATRINRRRRTRAPWPVALLVIAGLQGCEGAGNAGLFDATSQERWTIRCGTFTPADVPDPVAFGQALADMLRQVRGLRPHDVRVVTSGNTCTIYYGQYVKVASPRTGQLVFPEKFQQDMQLIRSLVYNQTATPFLRAQPELIVPDRPPGAEQWDVAHVRGTHSLLIAVFYNTPTFSERRSAAEEYVRLLRQAGYAAYYYHEPVKSFVFVGDFDATDIVQTPEGPRYGPRVEQLIASNEAEFRHFTENGHIRLHHTPDGQVVRPETRLMPVPRPTGESGLP